MGRSNTRWWVLRLSAIFMGFLPLFAVELLVRWTWNPHPADRVDPFLDWSENARLFEPKDDAFVIPSSRFRWFAPVKFSAIKSTGTKRIFCLGGSTTQGEPFKPPTAFPTWLRINLELANPNQSLEVINCGGLSYASYRLLPLVNEVLDYEPDLIVLDCGHNEFLENRELTEWKSMHENSFALHASRSLRVVQFLSSTLKRESPATAPARTKLERDVHALLDNQGGLEKYHRSELDRESVAKSMRWNVQSIVEACQQKHVPILLLIPTSNVLNTPPFKIESSPWLDGPSLQELEHYWSIAIDRSSDPSTVVDAMHQVLRLDPEHAGALYWLGNHAYREGRFDDAAHYLKKARDHDVCPLRANEELMRSIRIIAEQSGAWCLDVNALFESISEHSLVGDRWLVDHVHPRIEGHQLMGEKIAELLLSNRWMDVQDVDWKSHRAEHYRKHLSGLSDDYFHRGKQRLEGLLLWTQGRARLGRVEKPK
jgi:hypothetical protein